MLRTGHDKINAAFPTLWFGSYCFSIRHPTPSKGHLAKLPFLQTTLHFG